MLGLMRVAAVAIAVVGMDGAAGGWAVVTVENPPATMEVGARYRLEFTVRQHGVEPMNDLAPTVSVEGTPEVRAERTSAPGRYLATITAPGSGSAKVRIDAGWHETSLTLMPVPVVAQGTSATVVAPAEWGRHLFVAKGCGTCHINNDVPEFAALNRRMKVGPDLTKRRLEAAYVRQRITDPASLPQTDKWNRMPNLGLSSTEADALVALLK